MYWRRFRNHPCSPIGNDGRCITGSSEHIKLSYNAAKEGIVLLKNDNILPLTAGTRVALFGKASVDYVKGGWGSGDVYCAYAKNLCSAMAEKSDTVETFLPLNNFYDEYVKSEIEKGEKSGKIAEPEIPADLFAEALSFCNTAIFSVCRFSGEGYDRTADDFYLTDAEKRIAEKVFADFENVIVVLNVGGIVDTSYYEKFTSFKGLVLAWQGGMEGASALADVLCGDANPSGKLPDTFAHTFDDYPSSHNFNESEKYAEYTEDVFVGYRYFETIPGAVDKVAYPFGFGLSYTEFEFSDAKVTFEHDNANIYVTVKNTGNMSGKEVVQIYASCNAAVISRPKKELKAFAKTALLEPGESEKIRLSFKISDLAYYNEEKAAYVLEKGEYYVLLGKNASETTRIGSFVQPETVITEQLENRCVPHKLSKILLADGTYKQLEISEYEYCEADTTDWPEQKAGHEYMQMPKKGMKLEDGKNRFDDVADGKITLDELLDQMSVLDYIDLAGGANNEGVSNTMGVGGLDGFRIPAIMTADGPAGLRLDSCNEIPTTAWPCATMLASTFNTDLMKEIGTAGAMELEENNLGVWLAPAVNIHRSPLCGRNFEYYSEDPILAGEMAAAFISGVQTRNVGACIKHFVCNNKETNRNYCDSIVSERALREIYLKPFEIAIKKSAPLALMTCYNIVNGHYPSETKDLVTGVLREEWKFEGMVMTDWWNCGDQYVEIKAGNNLKMPDGHGHRLLKAYESGEISANDLRENAKQILKFILKFK